jgi:hypothetical protein
MVRIKGTNSYSATFEPQVAGPLDARQKIETQSDLLLESTWLANDGGDYSFVGMIVSVNNDGTEANNGVYRLKGKDYTDINNWEKLGSSGDIDGGSFI